MHGATGLSFSHSRLGQPLRMKQNILLVFDVFFKFFFQSGVQRPESIDTPAINFYNESVMATGISESMLRRDSDTKCSMNVRCRKCAVMLILVALCFGSLACQQQQPSSGAAVPTATATISDNVSAPIDVPSTALKVSKDSPLEKAHKEYLEAYEAYVQALRENGPQTMETLNALADYQKKYQLYQMILRAQDR